MQNNIQNPDVSELLNIAVQHHQSGEIEQAGIVYKKILATDPNHSVALHLLGVLSHQSGQHDTAVKLMRKAIDADPEKSFRFLNELGNVHKDLGEFVQAAQCYGEAATLQPDYAESYYGLANIYRLQGEVDEAVACYKKVIQLNSGSIESHIEMGDFFAANHRMDAAILCYEKLSQSDSIEPVPVFVRLGILHGKLDDLDRAIFYFRKALDVMPESDVANYNLGLLFQKQNDFDKALLAYQKVLAVNPQHIDSYINMGALCQSQGDFDGAISCYRKVIQLKPEHALAYGNLGLALRKQNKLEEATQWFEKSLSLDPNQADCLSNYVYQLKDICDWEKLKVFGERLDAINQKAIDASVRTPETPFINLTRHSDPALNYAVAKSWVDNMGCQMPEKGPQFSFDRHRHSEGPIIIGYLSNNFGNHPVAHLMHNIYGLHDRNNFTIICYSYGKNDGSEYRAIIEKGCDKFVDLFHLSALDSANCINEDQVDILVDLVGHTEDNRMAICAYRPAPVQAAYLGFPGTSGADFIDYIITDRIVTPECDAPNYSEKFVYMPDSYQVNDKLSEVSAYQLKKCDFGLPEKSFIFCSFNRSYKIDPVMFDCWMKILQKVDQSVLWLLSGGKVTERNLKREAKARGIDPERLIFAGIMPLKEHLARHVFADIALDTCIYNGGATTSHALKAGVPLIALQGSHFLSRMSASSLSAAGLPELVASDLEEYESLAVRLAGHPAELKSIKVKLQKNCLAGPIFDTSRFVSNLERAYKRMWQAYLSGEGARQEIFF